MEGKDSGLRILTWNINGLRSFDDFAQTIRDLIYAAFCEKIVFIVEFMNDHELLVGIS